MAVQVTKSQIEQDLMNKGDFVKIDHLNRFLKIADSLDVKKFILLKLSEIHIAKGFHLDAAKNFESAADIAPTYKEKVELYMKEAELQIKTSQFDLAERTFQKALAFCNPKEKFEVQKKYSEFYFNEARTHEKAMRHRKAAEFYERIYSMPGIDSGQRNQIKQKLVDLYNKLGKIRDAGRISSRPERKQETRNVETSSLNFEDLGIRRL